MLPAHPQQGHRNPLRRLAEEEEEKEEAEAATGHSDSLPGGPGEQQVCSASLGGMQTSTSWQPELGASWDDRVYQRKSLTSNFLPPNIDLTNRPISISTYKVKR